MVGLSRKRVFPKTKGDSITGQDRAQKHCDFRFSQIEKNLKSQFCNYSLLYSTLDKQLICVNTQLKSSKKQLKLDVCVPKSNSNDRYAITCDVIAYHLVHFVESGSFRPRSSSPYRRFAPVVVSPLVDSPQEEKSTYFDEIYVNS